MQTADSTTSLSVDLEKGLRSRAEEERIAADCILNVMAAACGLSDSIAIEWQPGDSVDRAEHNAPADWQGLLAGRLNRVLVGDAPDPPRAIFPGAFNPLHQGHRRMCEIAERLLNASVAFEISITNVDKPPLDFIEIENRVRQTAGERPLWLTRAPTFAEKASLFPNTVFLIGVDTLVRIAEPRYYDGNRANMLSAIDVIARAGCRFLVFGRQNDGAFRKLADLNLPPSLAELCQEMPEAEFREDISSTELRGQNP